jgi:small subunit ribosomal protein S17
MEQRGNRRQFTGTVVTNKNDKTIAVLVVNKKPHPKYKKLVTISKKFFAHDEKNEAKIGDIVTIVETRPLSRTKRFRLVSIDKRGFQKVELKEDATNGAKGN